MASIVSDASVSKVIVGVDTHKHIHVAVALNEHGARLGDRAVSADRGGYAQLEAWAQQLGRVEGFGIEGTGSYGGGLASYLRRCGHRVVEPIPWRSAFASQQQQNQTLSTLKPPLGRSWRGPRPRFPKQLMGWPG